MIFRNMIKVTFNILSICILQLSANTSNAQLTSPLLTCSNPAPGGFPFTIKFLGNTAEVSFKGNQFRPRFTENWVSPSGDKWTEYVGDGIIASMVASDNWVSLSSQQFPKARPMSSCTVR